MMMAERAEYFDKGVTLWSKRAALVLVGWFASSGYHDTLTTHKAVQAIPALEAQANCEEWRANKNGHLALRPEVITKDQLAKDNCPHQDTPVP